MNLSREDFVKSVLERKLPSLIKNDLLTHIQGGGVQDVYANLERLSLIPEEIQRDFSDRKQQMPIDYFFSFYLGKLFEKKQLNLNK